jgi:hypothetical protein
VLHPGAFGGLLAYFILLYMDGLGGLGAYRWVFIIEVHDSFGFSLVLVLVFFS